eukprot:TRINITY_DN16257_c0_g1_i1.p1 TRINITY_DN16257_c0_g1~~TRINITY_DN16257_c0_g1_i1.p1  ORF type:complete len:255 (+),score=19.28 TRINITY_DN16257_c0_g1_i1:656-1420(+)
MYEYPSLTVLLRTRRLQYLARVICDAPVVIPALVQQTAAIEGSWAKQIIEDLRWAQLWSCALPTLPDPRTSTIEWEMYTAENRKKWSRAVKALLDDVKNGHIPDSEDAVAEAIPATESGEFLCAECGEVHTTLQGLNLHKKKIHRRTSSVRPYAGLCVGAPHKCNTCRQTFGNSACCSTCVTICAGTPLAHVSASTYYEVVLRYQKKTFWGGKPKRCCWRGGTEPWDCMLRPQTQWLPRTIFKKTSPSGKGHCT